MKRVILFGGSFDPIHNGHLEIAKAALKQRHADELWFIVSKRSPFKEKSTPFKHRYKMCQIMTHYHRKMKVSDIENTLPDPSYTIDTVKTLKKKYPDIHFEWLIGSDQIEGFSGWKDYDTLLKEINFLVYKRPGYDVKHHFIEIYGAMRDVSSTAIRLGKSVDTHKKVLRYMTENVLYLDLIVKERLSKIRYEHVLRVTDLAMELSGNDKQVQLAALAHDLTKELSPEKQVLAMHKTGYTLEQATALYHGYTASSLLSKEYYIRDRQVLRAIRGHVSGSNNNRIAKLLYIADKCERGRNYDSENLINAAKENLDKGFKLVKRSTEEFRKREKN